MANPRKEPYLWVTWITKLLAGEANCLWQAWFKAHYENFDRQPRSGDLTTWTARHAELVRKRAAELQAQGYEVWLEEQNKFTLRGERVTLQGKADIVARKDADVVVVDCKTGKQRDSDRMQVFVYMMVLPETHHACKGLAVRGEVEYPDETVELDALPHAVRMLIASMIGRVGQEAPLEKTPSFQECRFCDLTREDCPERIEQDTHRTVKTGLF